MNKLLKNKKDFTIAIILTTLIVYALISRLFNHKIQNWLLTMGNFRLSNMNQPKTIGSLAVTFWTMAILLFVIIILFKKSLKQALIALLIGAAVGTLTFAAYFWDCDLIASVVGNVEASNVTANGWGNDDYDLVMTKEQEKELIAYCEKLEPLTGAEQKKFQEELRASDGQFTAGCLHIWVMYPKKYGHNFDLMVCVYHDMIYVRKGYDNHFHEIATGCKDNGLLEFVKSVDQKNDKDSIN